MLQIGGYSPPAGLLAGRALRAPLVEVRRPLYVERHRPRIWFPGRALVTPLEIPPQPKTGVRIVGLWQFDGETDQWGRLEIPLDLAISVVQTPTVYTGSGTSASKAFGSNVTAGNALFISSAFFKGSGTAAAPTSIADTRSNTFTIDVSKVPGVLAARGDLFASAPNTGAGADTITITWAASYTIRGIITEVTGLATSSILDASNNAAVDTGNSTTPSANLTPVAANVIIFGHLGSEIAANRTITYTGGGTELGQVNTGSSAPMFSTVYKVDTTTVTHSWTISGTAGNWKVLMASYKAPAAGVTVIPPSLLDFHMAA